MAQHYVSVRTLINDLVGIRLYAASNSLWNVVDTARNYAMLALNDAIAQYPVRVQHVYCSAVATTTGAAVGLPARIARVNEVRAVTGELIHHYDVRTLANTTLLYLTDGYTGGVNVDYSTDVTWFPVDTTLAYDSQYLGGTPSEWLLATVNVQQWTAGLALHPLFPVATDVPTFPPSGHLEITNPAIPGYEVVEYYSFEVNAFKNTTSADAFHVQARRVAGGFPHETGWTNDMFGVPIYAKLSFAIACPAQHVRPMEVAAEAAMYQYWMRDFANYSQYTAIASKQYMTAKELMQIINTLEARAVMYSRSVGSLTTDTGRNRLRTRLPR